MSVVQRAREIMTDAAKRGLHVFGLKHALLRPLSTDDNGSKIGLFIRRQRRRATEQTEDRLEQDA
eukprot:4173061-Pyramimonas_sp.AAC.1